MHAAQMVIDWFFLLLKHEVRYYLMCNSSAPASSMSECEQNFETVPETQPLITATEPAGEKMKFPLNEGWHRWT